MECLIEVQKIRKAKMYDTILDSRNKIISLFISSYNCQQFSQIHKHPPYHRILPCNWYHVREFNQKSDIYDILSMGLFTWRTRVVRSYYLFGNGFSDGMQTTGFQYYQFNLSQISLKGFTYSCIWI